MRELWNKFVADESGQGLVEYVLIIALIAVGLIAVLIAFRGNIATVFNDIGTTLEAQPGDPEPAP